MSVFSKIRGTIETIFQIGLGGPQLKNSSGVVEARNSSDAAYAIVRGATPVGNDDLATKSYVDAGSALGAIKQIRFVIGTSTVSSATSIPANAVVSDCQVKITTPYSGGATISVGRTGSTSLLMATTDNLPQSSDTFQSEQDTAWGASPLAVLVTIGGSPGAGAGVVIVNYSIPQS
jgi:hypothetical protein